MATRNTASKKKRSTTAGARASKASRKKKKKTTRKKMTASASVRKKAQPKKKPPARKKAGGGAARRSTTHVVSGPGLGKVYKPRRGEEYMSKAQLEHFRDKLMAWREEIRNDLLDTMNHLREDATHLADPNDRATQESEFALELRTRDRERKLLRKIDAALNRIDDGTYGYCEETGDEIGLARLEIRPVATLCVEAQEQRERREKQFADDR